MIKKEVRNNSRSLILVLCFTFYCFLQSRMYHCQYCGKGFNQKGNLKAHIYGHTGERPFQCDVCGKGFTLASTLNTHKRTHAPKKPFECHFCGKSFYQRNALKTHYLASHPYTGGQSLL